MARKTDVRTLSQQQQRDFTFDDPAVGFFSKNVISFRSNQPDLENGNNWFPISNTSASSVHFGPSSPSTVPSEYAVHDRYPTTISSYVKETDYGGSYQYQNERYVHTPWKGPRSVSIFDPPTSGTASCAHPLQEPMRFPNNKVNCYDCVHKYEYSVEQQPFMAHACCTGIASPKFAPLQECLYDTPSPNVSNFTIPSNSATNDRDGSWPSFGAEAFSSGKHHEPQTWWSPQLQQSSTPNMPQIPAEYVPLYNREMPHNQLSRRQVSLSPSPATLSVPPRVQSKSHPQSSSSYQSSSVTPKKQSRRTNNILSTKPQNWYPPLARTPDHRNGVPYTIKGEILPGYYFSAPEMVNYLYNHPLHSVFPEKDSTYVSRGATAGGRSKELVGTVDLKQSPLRLWIQKVPSDSARRYPSPLSSFCRFEDCFAGHKLRVGQFRIAIDELTAFDRPRSDLGHDDSGSNSKIRTNGKTTEMRNSSFLEQTQKQKTETDIVHDPYINAGYMHLFCVERLLNFPHLCANLNINPDTRVLPREPDMRNRMALEPGCADVASEFIERCEATLALSSIFEEHQLEGYPYPFPVSCRGHTNNRLQKPSLTSNSSSFGLYKNMEVEQEQEDDTGDKGRDAYNAPHSGTLTQLLCRKKREDEPPIRGRIRAERNGGVEPLDFEGDLRMEEKFDELLHRRRMLVNAAGGDTDGSKSGEGERQTTRQSTGAEQPRAKHITAALGGREDRSAHQTGNYGSGPCSSRSSGSNYVALRSQAPSQARSQPKQQQRPTSGSAGPPRIMQTKKTKHATVSRSHELEEDKKTGSGNAAVGVERGSENVDDDGPEVEEYSVGDADSDRGEPDNDETNSHIYYPRRNRGARRDELAGRTEIFWNFGEADTDGEVFVHGEGERELEGQTQLSEEHGHGKRNNRRRRSTCSSRSSSSRSSFLINTKIKKEEEEEEDGPGRSAAAATRRSGHRGGSTGLSPSVDNVDARCYSASSSSSIIGKDDERIRGRMIGSCNSNGSSRSTSGTTTNTVAASTSVAASFPTKNQKVGGGRGKRRKVATSL